MTTAVADQDVPTEKTEEAAVLPADPPPPLGEGSVRIKPPMDCLVEKMCSTDITRYTLGGVFFDGKNLVAVDGHGLVAVEAEYSQDDKPVTCAVIIPADAFKVWRRANKKSRYGSGGWMSVSKKTTEIENDGSKQVFQNIEGKFPDWRKVLPEKGRQTIRIAVNPELLLRAVEGAGISQSHVAFDVTIKDGVMEAKPIEIVTTEGRIAVVMPLRP